MLRSTTRRQRTTPHLLTFVNRREQRKGVRLLAFLLCISFMLLMYACPAILKNGDQVLTPITSNVLPEREREYEREAVPELEPEQGPEGKRELEAESEREREGEREAVPEPEPEPEPELGPEGEREAVPKPEPEPEPELGSEEERELEAESEGKPEPERQAVPELELEMRPEGELEPGPEGEPVQVSEPEQEQPEPQDIANDKEQEPELRQPQIFLSVVISADYSLDFLPYYIQYYLDLGIPAANFVPLVHTKHNDSDNLNRTLAILEEFRIKPKMIWRGVFDIRTKGVQRLLAMKDIPTSAWIVDSDDDELQEYPHDLFSQPQNHSHESPLIQLLRYCEAHNISVVKGKLIDRLASDCKLRAISPRGTTSPFQEYPIEADVTSLLLRANTGKMVVYRACYRAEAGIHVMNTQCNLCADPPFCAIEEVGKRPLVEYSYFPKTLKVHHFKWRENAMEKLTERFHVYKERNIKWFIESERFIKHYEMYKRILAPQCPNSGGLAPNKKLN